MLRTFEDLVLNWDKRNEQGIEPMRKYIDDIQSISSIEDMTDYQASLERNPFNLGLIVPTEVIPQIIQVNKSMVTQIVAGTNYKVLCTGSDGNLYVVTWYGDLSSNSSLTSAECVNIGAYSGL